MATPITAMRTVPVRTYVDIHEEGNLASGTVYPGTVVTNKAGVTAVLDGTAATVQGSWGILQEQEADGSTMATAYVGPARTRLNKLRRGDRFRSAVAVDAAETVYAAGAIFTPNSLGVLVPYTQATMAGQALADGLMSIGTLAISASAAKFKTTTTAYFRINGIQYSKGATDNLTFTAADTINKDSGAGVMYGVWLVQIDAAGTVSTKPGGGLDDQVYTSAAAALAALPDPDADNVALGIIKVASPTGTPFTANTTVLTTIGTYVNGTIPTTTFNLNPILFENVVAMPAANHQSSTIADRVGIFEVL